MKIFLAGFMAAGKSTVAKILAEKQDLKFYDNDEEIVKREGKSIPEIFAQHGEAYFRKVEKETVNHLLESKEDAVIALGGGAVLDDELREKLIEESEIFCIDVSAEEVIKRCADSEIVRPLLEVDDPLKKVRKLLEERREVYQDIPEHIDSNQHGPEEIAEEILKRIPDQKIEIKIENNDIEYPVIINNTYKKNSFKKILNKIAGRKVLLVADKEVITLHGKGFIELLEEQAEIVEFKLEAGEKIKDLKYLNQAYDILYDNNFTRSDYVIAFGGGTIGDLAGFIASTYLRGLKLIQMPTTLISQLDSSVGGKTAVNFKDTKNLIGSFYQAEMVYYHLDWLKTLPKAEIKSGLGEVIKYAILDGDPLFSLLKSNQGEILKLEEKIMQRISKISLEMKNYYVAEDVKDKGLRKKLNLGHSFGHAVEGAEKFKYKHGEAVVMGISFTAFLSNKIGVLNDQSFRDIINLLQNFNYQLFPSKNIGPDDLAQYIAHDKKISDNKMWWVLINDIGDTYLSDKFDHKNIKKYLEEYLCKKWL
ncbi:3-dehydroquinate synthase [Halanaerobium hydrogeniformans]|uniref:Shikimate kinase n=1 Tax=Halanaerobium hydrogeniformans TaxID=656519 RepID=E4RLB8_HALHG|nr:3-dehydroquinate synthase [Halanaerobium hydrogeniformans]ADQ14832.1 3-dehydroquinate synthase [Halanaerobium hydrogeniformans]